MDTAGTRIDIVSDAICPWCYIGKRQLERALAILAAEGMTLLGALEPVPAQSRTCRSEGRDRAAYRAAKFGSAEQCRARSISGSPRRAPPSGWCSAPT